MTAGLTASETTSGSEGDNGSDFFEPSESTVVRLPSIVSQTSPRQLISIYGVDRSGRGDLVFTVLLKGDTKASFIRHRDMQRMYPLELIAFYERFLQFKEMIMSYPYKPLP
jgi:hypothetical protein